MINKISGILIIFILGFSSIEAQEENTFLLGGDPTIVVYPTSTKVFPCKWRKKKTNPRIQSIHPDEIERTNEALTKALDKYPEHILHKYLQQVFVFRSMAFFGLEYGGTYHKKKVYITNNGVEKGYSNEYIEGTLHHEFSSILLKHNRKYFNKKAWHAANPADFEYGDGGLAALQTASASLKLDTSLFEKGFLNQYSMASVEEDFNCYMEYLFLSDDGFWAAWQHYEPIRKKTDVIISFLQQLDSQYNLEYFRKE